MPSERSSQPSPEQVVDAAREVSRQARDLIGQGADVLARASGPAKVAAVVVPVAVVGVGLAVGVAWGLGALWSRHRAGSRGRSAWLDRLGRLTDAGTDDAPLLRYVRETLCGLNRSGVSALLGTPSAAEGVGVGAGVEADPSSSTLRGSPRWYYRLHRAPGAGARKKPAALLVEFDASDRASAVRFLNA